jgi:hypothetical protein
LKIERDDPLNKLGEFSKRLDAIEGVKSGDEKLSLLEQDLNERIYLVCNKIEEISQDRSGNVLYGEMMRLKDEVESLKLR